MTTGRQILEYGHTPVRRRWRWVDVSRAVAIGLGLLWVGCVIAFIFTLIVSRAGMDW